MAKSKRTMDELMVELGDKFRGLWTSFEISPNGRIKQGWSVTFAHGNKMVEVPYQKTAQKALATAVNLSKIWSEMEGD